MAKAAGTFAVLLGGGTSTRGMAKAAGTFAVLLGGVDLKAEGGRQEKGEDEKGGQALREEDAAAKR